MMGWQKLIKEINQQIFTAFFTKKLFETKVSIGIEIFTNHDGYSSNGFNG